MNKNSKSTLEYVSNLQQTIICLKADCERKNELLKSAHETLMAFSYEIDIGLLADIEDELKEKL